MTIAETVPLTDTPGPADARPADALADALTLRVLSALLREDVLGLRTRSHREQRPDGDWLVRGRLALPVAPDGFQCELAARLPLLEQAGQALTDLAEILAALRAQAEEADHEGFTAFAAECAQTLATMRLHEAEQPAVLAALSRSCGTDPADWTGRGPASASTCWPPTWTTRSTRPRAAAPVSTSRSCASTHRSATPPSCCAGWWSRPRR